MADISTLDTATRGHHPDSPSSLQSSEACPAFLNEQRESKASKDGTLQHKATETRDTTILEGNESHIWAVEQSIAYEDSVIGQFKLSGKRFTIRREIQLTVGDDAVTQGFPDIVVIGDTHAAIIDYKFGRVSVTPTKDNLQGIAYALGLFHLHPELKTIEVHFFAPHQKWGPEDQRLKFIHTFHRDEAAKLELRVRTVIARKHEAAAQIEKNGWDAARPKHDLCIWCARKGVCPKVQALVIQTSEKYHDLVVPDEVKEYRLTRPEQIGQAYKFANQIEAIAKAIKARCVDASVTEDLLPPGFKLVKTVKREVKSVLGLIQTAMDHGLTQDEIIEHARIPFEAIEDAIKAKAPKGTAASKIRAFDADLNEAGVTVPGKPYFSLRESKTPAEKQEAINI